MSRSFTITAECLGTKLEWDSGHSLAESVVDGLSEELESTCLANQVAGDGYCGTVTHRMEGLVAYYHMSSLATEMFKRKGTAHAVMLRGMCNDYEGVMHSCAELAFLLGEESLSTNAEAARHIVDKVLSKVEEMNVAFGVPCAYAELKTGDLIGEDLIGEGLTLNELQTIFDTQDWALTLTVSASC